MDYTRIILALAVYIAIRLIYNRFFSSPAATMSHGKVIAVDNPVIYKALTSSGPVVVDFFATWCGPCKAIDGDTLARAFYGRTRYKDDDLLSPQEKRGLVPRRNREQQDETSSRLVLGQDLP